MGGMLANTVILALASGLLAGPARAAELPPARLFVWQGAEDLGRVTALPSTYDGLAIGNAAGFGADGHLRIGRSPLALSSQFSLALAQLGETPAFGFFGWSALGGLRVLPPPLPGGPRFELDLLMGPSFHGSHTVGVYFVDGAAQDAFFSLRLNGRLFAPTPDGRASFGPSFRLETQPVFVIRRVHRTGEAPDDSLQLRWNGHWAMAGLVSRVVLARGVAVQIEAEVGVANWGGHELSSITASGRIGLAFGEGLER